MLRNCNISLWDAVLQKVSFCPVAYLQSMIDYQLSYQRSFEGSWHDISCIILSGGKPVAVWPLAIAEVNNQASLSSQGRPILPPLFVENCPPKTRKNVVSQCFKVMNTFISEFGMNNWRSVAQICPDGQAHEWHLKAMEHGSRCSVRHELYVDLSLTLPDIKARFRKSYRALVTSGSRNWEVDVLRAPGDCGVWEEFRRLHKRVSGGSTRSLESWELQFAALSAGQGFLVLLRDSSSEMVGAGYFACSRDEGLYASAAYDRALFDKPLGHVVQYRAIQELKSMGCRWYAIGARHYPSDDPTPTDKEISISYFKQGFATHAFPFFVLA